MVSLLYIYPKLQSVTMISTGKITGQSKLLRLYVQSIKTFSKDVGMAVPKTTETRCRDGSGQARHVIQRLHK